eukprot:5670577-Ditylum_brightwellii.AAC.1
MSLFGGGKLAATTMTAAATMAATAIDGGNGEEWKGDGTSVAVCSGNNNGSSGDDGVDAIILILF